MGYMYAIHHGAYAVYDVSSNVTLLQDHVPMLACDGGPDLTDTVTGTPCLGAYTVLNVNASGQQPSLPVYNPYPLFGGLRLWPRGMTTYSSLQGSPYCFKRAAARPLIQQALIDGQPDLGTRPFAPQGSLPLSQQGAQLDDTAFSVVLPAGVATPLNR